MFKIKTVQELIEKYIDESKFVSDVVGHRWPDEMYENIKECKFVDVTLTVDNHG